MSKIAVIVKPVSDGDSATTIMDEENYTSFPADISSDVEGLNEDDRVIYEEDSSGNFSYTIIGKK